MTHRMTIKDISGGQPRPYADSEHRGTLFIEWQGIDGYKNPEAPLKPWDELSETIVKNYVRVLRAGDMDWQSGQPKRPADGSGVSHEAPTESEYVRQCDRKLIPGPPSERQRQRLEQEKARRGGEGKVPF